jgi:diguanylate cyclase (GGDEF)-like protein/PAS domain S-box-containing protein
VVEREIEPRAAAIAALLAAHPDAIVAALADDGFRIELPGAFPLGEHPALEVPSARATILDIVVPGDRLGVVTAWEQARCDGIAVTAVHALSDPGTRLTLTMIDARGRYGIWLAVLSRDGEDLGSAPGALAGPLVVPTRPRQATLHKNMTALITAADENVSRMFGFTREQLIGSRSSEFLHPDDQERAVSTWMQLLATRGSQRVRLRHRRAAGGWLWVEIENIHNGAEEPDDVDVIAHISDISDEMAAHEALRRREQLFSRLAEALPTGVLQLSRDGSVIYANARLSEILQTVTPISAADLLATVTPRDRPVVTTAVQAALSNAVDSELEVEICPSQARRSRRCAITVAAVDDQEGQPAALICLTDVTESARLREELRLQATHDALTGLPNHRALIAAIDHELECTHRTKRQFALLFLDLDHFKALNDTLGHGAGDNALQETGQIIKASVRTIDTVGRWGGEEFVAVLPETDTVAALNAAERIRAAIAMHEYTSVEGTHLTCSIGVAIRPDHGSDRDTLLSSADRAMYMAKQLGRNQVIAANA